MSIDGYGLPIGRLNEAGGGDPRAADAAHIGKGQIIRRSLGGNAARGAESEIWQRAVKRFEITEPARWFSRKEFKPGESEFAG